MANTNENRVQPGRNIFSTDDEQTIEERKKQLAQARRTSSRGKRAENKKEDAATESEIVEQTEQENNKGEHADQVREQETTENPDTNTATKQEVPSYDDSTPDENSGTVEEEPKDANHTFTLEELLTLDVDEEDGLISGKRENLRVTQFTKDKVQVLMTLIGTDFINETIHKSLDLAAETLDAELQQTYKMLINMKAKEYRKKGLSTGWKYKDEKSINKHNQSQ